MFFSHLSVKSVLVAAVWIYLDFKAPLYVKYTRMFVHIVIGGHLGNFKNLQRYHT